MRSFAAYDVSFDTHIRDAKHIAMQRLDVLLQNAKTSAEQSRSTAAQRIKAAALRVVCVSLLTYPAKETYVYGKRDLRIRQKRPTLVRYTHDNSRSLLPYTAAY